MARHPFDLVAFTFGVVVTALAAAYVVGAYTDLRLDGRLVLPMLLVGLGAVGLTASLLAQRRSDRRVAADSAAEAEAVEEKSAAS